MVNKWDDDYVKKFHNSIKSRLPADFVAMYERYFWFHDWCVVDFHVANSGRFLQTYSKRGKMTFELHLTGGDANKHLLLSYIDVQKLELSLNQPNQSFSVSQDCMTNTCIKHRWIRDSIWQ